MDELSSTELERSGLKVDGGIKTPTGISFPMFAGMRQKPGPKKKDVTRSEKLTCRLTKEEKRRGELCCKAHGLTEAKLLRASYLAAITEPPPERFDRFVNVLTQPLEVLGLSHCQKLTAKEKIRDVLKKSSLVLLLILLGGMAEPAIAKYVWFIYEAGKSLVYQPDQSYIYDTRHIGCQMVPDK